jgi:copper oxidase (laccase) domain-containing protein
MERIAVRKAKWHIDLWQANRWLLEEAGVHDIHVAGICTYNNSAQFYSARREGIDTGRNMNGIFLNA